MGSLENPERPPFRAPYPTRAVDTQFDELFLQENAHGREAIDRRLQLLIPDRFRPALFSNFSPTNESQRSALAYVLQWVDAARRGDGPMLAIVGNQGCGKSHLLYAACTALTLDRFDAYARPWYRLADELRYGGRCVFAPDRTDDPVEVRDRLWKQKIVLIDEIRATASTEFDNNELAKFACHAYDSRIAVLITTNENPIDRVMGAPAASRFTQVVVDGPDHRHAP